MFDLPAFDIEAVQRKSSVGFCGCHGDMPIKPPAFRPPGWKRAPSVRPGVHDPYYGTQAWRRLAAAVKQRDGFRCTQPDCPTPGRGYGGRVIAGHIKPRTAGGVDDPSNVRTFCPDCDNRWHSEKGVAGGIATGGG